MKRIPRFAAIAGAIALIALTSFHAHAAALTAGDLNADGKLTYADLTILRDSLLGRLTLTPAQRLQADVNGDKLIHVADMVALLNLRPAVLSFSINAGAPQTDLQTVILSNNASFGPTDYIAAETSDFSGAAWHPYSPSPAFTLSPGNGVKTVWFKVRNGFGTSAPLSASIDYFAPPGSPTLTLNLGGSPTVTMDLVRIPAGTFTMGTPSTERGRSSDEQLHTVEITRPFYLGKYEVTQAQWVAVTGYNPSQFQSGGSADLQRPVELVDWEAIAGPGGFIEKLIQHLNQTKQVSGVRLPTEAEWEYACRAGTATRFFFGDSLGADDSGTDAPTGTDAYPGNRSDYMWFWFNCQGNANGAYGSKPVGTLRPNAFGVYDMSGNVWEWCQDWYGPYPSGTVTDPQGPADGIYRVVRGGGWSYWAQNCRSGRRFRNYPANDVDVDLGFRLACDAQ